MDIFRCRHKTGLFLKIISIHLRVFLKVKVQNGNILGVAKISNKCILWVCQCS